MMPLPLILEQKNEIYKNKIHENITLCEKYRDKMDLKIEEQFINSQSINEVIIKLKSIQSTLPKLANIQTNMFLSSLSLFNNVFNADEEEKQKKEFMQLNIEATTLLESFYYTAFRINVIFRESIKPKKSFDAIGIRNIRNLLIEHPEVLTSSLGAIESPNGFIMKNVRTINFVVRKVKEEDVYQDKGLYINVEEFLNKLHPILIEISK